MDIILLNAKQGTSRTLRFSGNWLLVAVTALLVTVLAVGAGGYWWGQQTVQYGPNVVASWQQKLSVNQQSLTQLQRQSDNTLRALTIKFANMRAQLVRLDALGSRLVDLAGIKSEEFDFVEPPAIGGPQTGEEEGIAYQPPVFVDAIHKLAHTLDRRQQQLNILNGLLQGQHLEARAVPSGRPVHRGWISSTFGYRSDPFTGKLHMHEGIDYAARKGTKIYATASGVVTWAGDRYGYGKMVEIDQGNGLKTRYAHCEKVLVDVGDVVQAGQLVALVGATGHATGPHLHYEVIKNGVPVNPMPYIKRSRHYDLASTGK